MVSPYYVHPGMDIATPLKGFTESLGQFGQLRRIQQMKKGAQEAFATGDPNKIAEYMVQYPEIAPVLQTAMQVKQTGIGQPGIKPTSNMQDFMFYQTLLRENPDTASKFAMQVGIEPKPLDDRTNAIKEFEYGVVHPEFAISQKKKADLENQRKLAQQSFKDTTGLRKEFLKESKDYQTVRDAYARILSSVVKPSPAGDLSLIFNYMKMLDPNSVVRESEFATAASAGSYGERIKGLVNRVINGERLSESVRKDFVDNAKRLSRGSELQHRKRERNYKNIAKKNKLNPEEVTVDLSLVDPQEAMELTRQEEFIRSQTLEAKPVGELIEDELWDVARGKK